MALLNGTGIAVVSVSSIRWIVMGWTTTTPSPPPHGRTEWVSTPTAACHPAWHWHPTQGPCRMEQHSTIAITCLSCTHLCSRIQAFQSNNSSPSTALPLWTSTVSSSKTPRAASMRLRQAWTLSTTLSWGRPRTPTTFTSTTSSSTLTANAWGGTVTPVIQTQHHSLEWCVVVEVACCCFFNVFFYVYVLVEDVIGILLFWCTHGRNKTCLFVSLAFLAVYSIWFVGACGVRYFLVAFKGIFFSLESLAQISPNAK